MSHTVIEGNENLVDEGVVVDELFIEEYDIPLSLPDEDDRPTLDLRDSGERPLIQRPYVKLSLLGGIGLALLGGIVVAGLLYYPRKRSSWTKATSIAKAFAAKLSI